MFTFIEFCFDTGSSSNGTSSNELYNTMVSVGQQNLGKRDKKMKCTLNPRGKLNTQSSELR